MSRVYDDDVLTRKIATMLCQANRYTRDMPSEDEIQHAWRRAQSIIVLVRENTDQQPPASGGGGK